MLCKLQYAYVLFAYIHVHFVHKASTRNVESSHAGLYPMIELLVIKKTLNRLFVLKKRLFALQEDRSSTDIFVAVYFLESLTNLDALSDI